MGPKKGGKPPKLRVKGNFPKKKKTPKRNLKPVVKPPKKSFKLGKGEVTPSPKEGPYLPSEEGKKRGKNPG